MKSHIPARRLDSFMTHSLLRLPHALAVTIALATALPAQARNDVFHVAVASAMSKRRAIEAAGGLPLRFGSASAKDVELIPGEVEASGSASIVINPRRSEHLTDEQACQAAFEDAVGHLAQRARQAGGAALVGIVSAFKGEVVDDPLSVDCHAGASTSHVTLRAKLARTYAGEPVAPPPRAVAAASAERVVVLPRSGFAEIGDRDAVPLNSAGRDRYVHFLALPKPRAFAILDDGSWRFWADDPDAVTKVFDECAHASRRCWLYAVDDTVVWHAEENLRIDSAAALRSATTTVSRSEHQ